MQQRRDKQIQQESERRHGQQPHASSVLVSPPTASRNTSYPSLVDTSAISMQNVSTASAQSTAPVERLLKWSEKREEALQRIREEEEKRKFVESTFRPNLAKARSASSSSSVSSGGGGDAYYSYEQLHRSSITVEKQQLPSTAAKHHRDDVTSVTSRLLMQGQLSEMRKEYLRDTRNREIESQHTFQPVVLHHQSQPSHRDPLSVLQTTEAWDHKRGAIPKPEPTVDPECTFRPTINPSRRSSSTNPPARASGGGNVYNSSSVTNASSTRDKRSFGARDGDVSLHGTVLSTMSAPTSRGMTSVSTVDQSQISSAETRLEGALVDELLKLRAACQSAALDRPHPDHYNLFSAFLASMCETTNPKPVTSTFQSAAFHSLHEPQLQQTPVPQKHQNVSKPSTAKAHQPSSNDTKMPAATKKQQLEKDNDVLRDLSPIHRFVIADDETDVQEVSLDDLDSRSRSGSSLRFEVERDDAGEDSEFVNATSSTGMPFTHEVTPLPSVNPTPATLIPFDGFLMRQEQAYRAKQRRLEQLIRQTAPPLKPNICEHSRQLASKSNVADGKSSENSSQQQLRSRPKASYAVRSDELTFRPVITPVAASSAPRGFDDMHMDSHRRQEKLQQSAQKNDAERMNECTFVPHTNRQRNAQVESTLNPKNFGLYQEQIARQRTQQDARRATQERNAAVEEFSHCTFKPRVNRTPSYISRMTGSVSALREAAER